jgi:hypothetical protein
VFLTFICFTFMNIGDKRPPTTPDARAVMC